MKRMDISNLWIVFIRFFLMHNICYLGDSDNEKVLMGNDRT